MRKLRAVALALRSRATVPSFANQLVGDIIIPSLGLGNNITVNTPLDSIGYLNDVTLIASLGNIITGASGPSVGNQSGFGKIYSRKITLCELVVILVKQTAQFLLKYVMTLLPLVPVGLRALLKALESFSCNLMNRQWDSRQLPP